MDQVSTDHALNLLAENALPERVLTIPIQAAIGHRLAFPVTAKISRPFADLSAMDGYAVRLADVTTPNTRLTVRGEIAAGSAGEGQLNKHEAMRIFTGAPLPRGADHIIMQEDTERDADSVIIKNASTIPKFVRPLGQDFAAGDELLPKHHKIRHTDLALIAAANLDMVTVLSKPRVAILANGLELRPPGSTLRPGEIPNASPFGLIPLLESFGAEVINLGVAGDDKDAIAAKLKKSNDFDLFIPCGGASVGTYDLMKPAFIEAGFDLMFSKLAMRPGKPTWFGRRGEQRVLGLPGNPTSSLVCARLFGGPLLGHNWIDKLVCACLINTLPAEGSRDHFLRGQISISATAGVNVSTAADQDSGLLRPWVNNNALVYRTAGSAAARVGDIVRALPLNL